LNEKLKVKNEKLARSEERNRDQGSFLSEKLKVKNEKLARSDN